MHLCALCDCPIMEANDSREHVIPQAIGGRKKVTGFICRDCNSAKGHAWDAELAAQLNWFSVTLNINRETGAPPKQLVEAPDGRKIWLHADSTMTLAGPPVTVEKTESGRRFRLQPRTRAEARKKLEEIQRKYPQVDVEQGLATAVVNTTRPGVIKTSFQFGGELAGRSLVKTAVAMVYDMGLAPEACDFALRYLRHPEATPALAEFYVRDLVENRPSDRLVNSVTVSANPRNGVLSAYIEYFGVVRYVVHLSQAYSGPSAYRTYAINTATGKPTELYVNFELSDAEYAASLANETGDLSAFRESFDYAMPIALKSLYAREDEKAMNDAITATLEEMGVTSDAQLPAEKLSTFNTLVAQKLALHFLQVIRLRPKL